MANSLSFLGLVRKAGRLEIGEEMSGGAIRGGKAKILIIAVDASDNALRRAEGFSESSGVPLVKLPYTKFELSEYLDKSSPAMAAITEIGLAEAFMERLNSEMSGEYDELTKDLKAKAEKANKRRKEAAAVKKNAKMGKRRNRV